MLSLPAMNQINSKEMENNLLQEAILAASADIMDILTHRWDQNSPDSNSSPNSTNIDPQSFIIWMSDTDCDIDKHRPGYTNRSCKKDSTIRPTYTSDTFNKNDTDLDDMNRTKESIFLNNTVSSHGYKAIYFKDIIITHNINFDGENNITVDENIKQVRIIIKNDKGNTITRLDGFGFNIGDKDPISREFQ